jgi:signal transduction histidine kinase
VDGAIAIQVYRVLQEALSNVARHAGTDRAWVRLRFESQALVLEIEDHGRGFAAPLRHGLGIVAMRERAALVGGTIAFVQPRREGGTRVVLTVPLPPVASPARQARAG